MAVLEFKRFATPVLLNYHRSDNSLCAQIHSSFLGSKAPLGVLITNGSFKFFWRVKVADNVYHFFTYPKRTSLADFYSREEKEFFIQIFFHIVRCSIKEAISSFSPREAFRRQENTSIISTAEKLKKKRRLDENGQNDEKSNFGYETDSNYTSKNLKCEPYHILAPNGVSVEAAMLKLEKLNSQAFSNFSKHIEEEEIERCLPDSSVTG